MSINSLSFIGFLIVALAAFHLLPAGWRARFVFPLTSLVFLALVLPNAVGCAAILGFCMLFWVSGLLVARRPVPGTAIGVFAGILLLFGWLKSYELLSFLPLADLVPTTIGLSYILIRGLQLLADMREDTSLRPGPLGVFSFLVSWPCLVSGPVQRYQDFESQLRGMASFRLSEELWRNALVRMVRGWFWVLVVGDLFHRVWIELEKIAFLQPFPIALGGAELFFLLHLFFNFAGYTEIVIGAGLLFGLRLPENFDRPFRARSFLDFWGRWHMSMSNWFKVYVFNPSLMAMTKRFPSPRASGVLGAAAFFLTFFLVGLWHGTSASYVVCGLLLGFGASVNQWYRAALRSALGKSRFSALSNLTIYRVVCTGFTFSYLCLSIAPLWLDVDEMKILVGGHGWKGIALAQLLVFGLAMVLFSWSFPKFARAERPWQSVVIMALQGVLIEIYLFLYPAFGGEFFYEQF